MTDVTRTAGVAGTFPVTFSRVPVEPPTVTIYSDSAHTVVAVPLAVLSATANPAVWTASYPATLAPGRYYLTISAVYTAGQPAFLDSDDTLVLEAAGAEVGDALVTLEQARAFVGATADDDADLTFTVRAVSAHLEREYGPLGAGSYTEHLPVHNGTVILPVGAVVTAVYASPPRPYGFGPFGMEDYGSQPTPLTGWHSSPRSGLLQGVSLTGGAVVTYTLPARETVQQAALYTIRHAWSMRSGAQPTTFGVPGEGAETALRNWFVPNIAKELLGVTPGIG